MSSQDLEEPWGQLVSLDRDTEDRIPIIGRAFTIGRGKDSDVVIPDNKHVSTCHCSLIRDEQGDIWLKDTSTNGTLVDNNKVNKDQVKLTNSMIIRVVFRKDNAKDNIGYKFVDLRSSQSNDIEPTLEMTQQYNEEDLTHVLDEINEETKDSTNKRNKEEDTVDAPPLKKLKEDEETTKEKEVEEKTEEKCDNKKLDTSLTQPSLNKKDSIEETLICEICQEILHDCVSLQPCTHTYCGGCYSEWMVHSNQCPACRITVERITKNFIVNNLVDAYLRANPDKKRHDDDLKELDAKNKITKDMLFPKKKKRKLMSCDTDEDDNSDISDTDESIDDTSSSDSSSSPSYPGPIHITSHPFPIPAPPPRCRQCPSYIDIFTSHSTHPTPPPYTCTITSNHVLCLCCLQPMPDRRSDSDITIPPQKCDVCSKAYCHMYWGCRKLGCRGCLNLFKDIDFDETILSNLICDNVYESRVLKDYMRQKSISLKDLLESCLEKLDDGTYHAPDTRTTRISSSTRTCYECALKNFKELAYQFRQGISSDDLPDEVTNRSNCHWGRNCRTQKHNYSHAERYNHICAQSKF